MIFLNEWLIIFETQDLSLYSPFHLVHNCKYHIVIFGLLTKCVIANYTTFKTGENT